MTHRLYRHQHSEFDFCPLDLVSWLTALWHPEIKFRTYVYIFWLAITDKPCLWVSIEYKSVICISSKKKSEHLSTNTTALSVAAFLEIRFGWRRVTYICVCNLSHHWFTQWLVACAASSHYLKQCWTIVNWTMGNKFQWHFNQKCNNFHRRKWLWKCRLENGAHFVSTSVC